MTKEQLDIIFGSNNYSLVKEYNWLFKLSDEICKEILHIETPTIIYQLIMEDGRYYKDLNVLAITLADVGKNLEIKKTLYHELRHAYQFEYMKNNNNKLTNYFKEELIQLEEKYSEYTLIEVDAYAFQKKMLLERDGIKYVHPNPIMVDLISIYERRFKKYFIDNN